MSPKVPKSYLAARRKEIIEAACKCFMEKGFHNITMQDIYETTKLSPGAVYNYFSSKEDIVAAAVEISQQRNSEIMSSAAVGEADDALSNVGYAILSLARQIDLVQASSLDLALYAEAIRNPHIAEALRKNQDAVIVRFVNLVKRSQAKGVFNSQLDAEAIAQVLVSLFVGLKIHLLLSPEINLDSYISVCDAIIHGTFSKCSASSSSKK